MAAPTEIYVDPSIAADSGSGTIGDPYGDLQYALNTHSRDTTNGNRINIKAGTDEILSAGLSFATWGTPTAAAPLFIEGYTSAAGDGGIGGIDANGFGSTMTSFVSLVNLHWYGSGSNILVTGGHGFNARNCEFNESTDELVRCTQPSFIHGCHFHDGSKGVRVNAGAGTLLFGNYFKNDGATDFVVAIELIDPADAIGNIISIDGASDGIVLWDNHARAIGNSILSAGGTGQGIIDNADNDQQVVLNNLVEGFSGSGGVGIQLTQGDVMIYGHNAVFNCATAYNVTVDAIQNLGDNETLSASPFAKSGADTFANRFVYFAPVDTGNVHGGAYVGA